jgi:6-phosphogluconolactonase
MRWLSAGAAFPVAVRSGLWAMDGRPSSPSMPAAQPPLPYQPATVAEALLAHLDHAAATRGRATLAIPGGRSPGPVLSELARICDPFVRERLSLLWLDERSVPLGHADRNDAPTLAAWQAGGPLPAHVHPMPAERGDLDSAAADYARILAEATGGSGVLDACLVGIGEDGHLASLFPDHPGLKELSPVFAVTDSPKPLPRRLTLGLSVLNRARAHLVLALGAAKGQVAARARRGPDPALPVSLLPPAVTTWYLDDAAAAAARP